MLAPASLVLMTMLLSAPPAHAGHWRYSAAGSTASATVITGIVTPGTPAPSPWLPPADADDALTLTLPGVSVQDTNDNAGQTPTCSCKAAASIQIKATWTHENPNTQNDTNDPPPTSVWVVETSSATWNGLPGRSDTGPGAGVEVVPPSREGEPVLPVRLVRLPLTSPGQPMMA